MQSFEDFDSFTKFIEVDSKRADLNPVRFINVETLDTWKRAKSYFEKHSKNIIKLSDFCEDEDTAPNFIRLKIMVAKTDGNALIIPLSEYLRINGPKAVNHFNELLRLNYQYNEHGKLRVYILLYRMSDILNVIETNPREKNSIIMIKENSETDYSLTIFDVSINPIGKGHIIGFKKYLIFWEQNPDKPICLITKNAIRYEMITKSDNVEVITTPHKFLQHLKIPFPEKWGDEDQWKWLISKYESHQSLDEIFSSELGCEKYNDSLYSKWKDYNSDKKWSLFLWSSLHTNNIYLKKIFQNISFFGFEDDIYNCIQQLIKDPDYIRYYLERREIISMMGLAVSDKTVSVFDDEVLMNTLLCLTDLNQIERRKIIRIVAEINNTDLIKERLKNIYPILHSYLKNIDINDCTLNNYFNIYKKSKIIDIPDSSLINDINNNIYRDKIWDLPSRNSIIEKRYDADSTILYIDALGVEHIETIKDLFENDKYDIQISCGRSNIPSITEKNNDFYKERNHLEPIFDLDQLKHKNEPFYEYIEKEFEIIKKIKSTVDSGLKDYQKIIIASDHGSSRLAVIARGKSHRAKEGSKKFAHGRYCFDGNNDYANIGCIESDGYWTFCNYDYFIEKGGLSSEIHGGASLEEMIVPIIIISKTNQKRLNLDAMNIIIDNPEPKIRIDKTVKVEFKITEIMNQKIEADVDGIKIICNSQDNRSFSFIHDVKNKDRYTATIFANGERIGVINYRISRPMKENKKFDI